MVRFYLLFLLCSVLLSIHACSQSAAGRPASAPVEELFAGSTPCDSAMQACLPIPAAAVCDFIRWEVHLQEKDTAAGQFRFSARYGESQPNTNGFYGGGTVIAVSGTYSVEFGFGPDPYTKYYRLKGDGLNAPILLRQLDPNILYFTDNNRQLLVGNGGYSFVLNRLAE